MVCCVCPQFLTERFGVVQSRSSSQVGLISEILHQSLTLGVGPDSSQPQLVSHSPEAISPRFKSALSLVLLLVLFLLLHHHLFDTIGSVCAHPPIHQETHPHTHPYIKKHTPTPTPRLLALGVKLLREKLLTNSVERTILREKIYNCVLDYFCYQPQWPTQETTVVRETVATLIKFWQSVRDMKNTSIVSLSGEDHVISHVTVV